MSIWSSVGINDSVEVQASGEQYERNEAPEFTVDVATSSMSRIRLYIMDEHGFDGDARVYLNLDDACLLRDRLTIAIGKALSQI